MRFVNAKVVTEVITRSSSGSGSSNGAKGGSVGTTTSHTGSGWLQICKTAGDSYVAGNFTFGINGTTQTVSVPTGQCSGYSTVTAGTVTISEASSYFPYGITAVSTQPQLLVGTVVAGGLPGGAGGGSAQVTVGAGDYVTATVTDGTILGGYKICKALADNQGSLAGTVFTFDTSWIFTPPTGAKAITGGSTVSVTAQPAGTVPAPCSWYINAPAGAVVTANETDTVPDVAVTNVAVVGNTTNTSSGSTATFTVPTDGSVADATFTNDPLGYIEVCKNFQEFPWWGSPATTTPRPTSPRPSRSTVALR